MYGARISVYQPRLGQTSTTVISGLSPKNSSVCFGWRYWSRATLAGVRESAAMAWSRLMPGRSGDSAAQAERRAAARSAGVWGFMGAGLVERGRKYRRLVG